MKLLGKKKKLDDHKIGIMVDVWVAMSSSTSE